VNVISSSDNEVSSDDAVSSDEELTSHEVSSDDEVSSEEEVTASNSKVYTSSASKALKASTSKNSKVSTSSASKSKASTSSLAAAHTWACVGNKTFGIRKPKDAIVADQDIKGKNSRLESRKSTMDISFTLGSAKDIDNLKILQSCNDLLLSVVLRMDFDFDPRKSLDYKVVQVGRTYSDIDIQVYSSETGNWRLCRDRFNYFSFDHFVSAIYYNDALHWLETKNKQLTLCKLNIEDHDHPIITTIEIPHGLHWGRNFLASCGSCDDLMLILIDIHGMLHLERRLFESCGCLLLVYRDDIGSREFTIYEMMNRCSLWMVRKEDSFLVINLSRKIVKYNLISKTISEIFDIGSNQMDDDDEFISPYTVDHNLYELIPSLQVGPTVQSKFKAKRRLFSSVKGRRDNDNDGNNRR
ncbi:hypothetical protein Tco_1508398, partial [Tanacetum coccineum]